MIPKGAEKPNRQDSKDRQELVIFAALRLRGSFLPANQRSRVEGSGPLKAYLAGKKGMSEIELRRYLEEAREVLLGLWQLPEID
jgi:hypothetical protein